MKAVPFNQRSRFRKTMLALLLLGFLLSRLFCPLTLEYTHACELMWGRCTMYYKTVTVQALDWQVGFKMKSGGENTTAYANMRLKTI